MDSSFSTLNEKNFIGLILYGGNKLDDKKNHFSAHHKIYRNFSNIWRIPTTIVWVLMVSKYVYHLRVYFRITIFYFNVFIFSPTEILYSRTFLCMNYLSSSLIFSWFSIQWAESRNRIWLIQIPSNSFDVWW